MYVCIYDLSYRPQHHCFWFVCFINLIWRRLCGDVLSFIEDILDLCWLRGRWTEIYVRSVHIHKYIKTNIRIYTYLCEGIKKYLIKFGPRITCIYGCLRRFGDYWVDIWWEMFLADVSSRTELSIYTSQWTIEELYVLRMAWVLAKTAVSSNA